MVFSTAQLFGIGAFTVIVVLIGALLLKLDSMIGTNYEVEEIVGAGPASQGSLSGTASVAQASAASPSRNAPRRKRRH